MTELTKHSVGVFGIYKLKSANENDYTRLKVGNILKSHKNNVLVYKSTWLTLFKFVATALVVFLDLVTWELAPTIRDIEFAFFFCFCVAFLAIVVPFVNCNKIGLSITFTIEIYFHLPLTFTIKATEVSILIMRT